MINKLNNMIKFTEYDHLQPKQKPTSRTEIGGFAVLEGLSVKELIKLASEKTGMSKKELKEYTPKKLKSLIGIKKGKGDEDEGGSIGESLVFEKKASPKQVAARKRFMEMINSKKKKPAKEEEKKKNENLISEKASDKQLAARKRFMEMISKKGNKKPDVVAKKRPIAKKVATRKKIM